MLFIEIFPTIWLILSCALTLLNPDNIIIFDPHNKHTEKHKLGQMIAIKAFYFPSGSWLKILFYYCIYDQTLLG